VRWRMRAWRAWWCLSVGLAVRCEVWGVGCARVHEVGHGFVAFGTVCMMVEWVVWMWWCVMCVVGRA
jgi:hypothetical protein